MYHHLLLLESYRGAMDIHKVIGYLPRPKKGWVLPGHKYTGPYNPLSEQLDENDIPIIGQEPFNKVDEISMRHDICYRDNPTGKKKCDDIMINELNIIEPNDWREKIDKNFASKVIGTKRRLGWGIKWTSNMAEELHKPVKKKFLRRYVFVRNVDDIWGADLIDLRSHSKVNGGNKYILMVIDIFSKYGWAVPIKYKTGEAVAEALESIFQKHTPKKLWVDEGKEFYNNILSPILNKYDIEIYSTHNDEKCSVIERWNRTIKTQLWKYFSANGTYKYVDILQALVDKYNNTRHRSIGISPVEARKPENHDRVFKKLYFKKLKKRTDPIFEVGDQVRITVKKNIFEKGYAINWSNKIYIIAEVKNTVPPTYKIKDDRGTILEGTFYEPELQKTHEDTFQIEKIISRKIIKGKKYARIKWKGYDNSYNTWEPEENVKDLKGH